MTLEEEVERKTVKWVENGTPAAKLHGFEGGGWCFLDGDDEFRSACIFSVFAGVF